jgi:hypothetical protein
MSCCISQYAKACNLCLWTKVQWCGPIGELHSLPILENHWHVISVDFIGELPDSHGHDVIMNVVESVRKQSYMVFHAVSCPTVVRNL